MASRPSAERARVRRRVFRQESLVRRAAKVSRMRTTIACRVMGLLSGVRQLPYGRTEGPEGFRDGGGGISGNQGQRELQVLEILALREFWRPGPVTGPEGPVFADPVREEPRDAIQRGTDRGSGVQSFADHRRWREIVVGAPSSQRSSS